jgi:F0F1-type ATP synthase gamma subunit
VAKAFVYTVGRSLFVLNVVVKLFASIKNGKIDAVNVVETQFVSMTVREAVVKNVNLRISALTVNKKVVAYPVKVLGYAIMRKLDQNVRNVMVGHFASTR